MKMQKMGATLCLVISVSTSTVQAADYVPYDTELAYAMVLATENDHARLVQHLRSHPELAVRIPGASSLLDCENRGVNRRTSCTKSRARLSRGRTSQLVLLTARFARANGYY